ncbi:MAG: formate--tetrahydrofolate ligase [Treponema sp.]|jgi:formate--tetrahydrofolate ligase|nr:formate--tetrahydrofolate ligase [Treponema sp.]
MALLALKLPRVSGFLGVDPPANQRLLGALEGFTLTVGKLRISAGAGFTVAFTGDIMTMPGLPKLPSAEGIDVDHSGKITGLF